MGIIIKVNKLIDKLNCKLIIPIFGIITVINGLLFLYFIPNMFLFVSMKFLFGGRIPIALLTIIGWIFLSRSFIDYKKVYKNKFILKYLPKKQKTEVKNLLILISTLIFTIVNIIIFLIIRPDLAIEQKRNELIEQVEQMNNIRNETIEKMIKSENEMKKK